MCFWKSYCQYMEQDINKFSLLPISLKTQGTFFMEGERVDSAAARQGESCAVLYLCC